MSNKNPILITGASGFVGAHLCLHFLKRGHDVVAIEGSSRGSWRVQYVKEIAQGIPGAGKFRSFPLDLTSRTDVEKALQEIRPSTLLNCAAYGAYPSQTQTDRIYQVNFEAVRTLLEAARQLPGLQAFIQAGSSSEYGSNCAAPTEDAATWPDSHYSVAKNAATQLVRFYAAKHGVPAWTLRLYAVYGPLEDASRLIPKTLLCALQGKLPPLVNPKISRDFVFVNDVCQAFEDLIKQRDQVRKGDIFNIGSGVKTRLEDLVSVLRSDFDVKETPNWGSMGDRAWDHADWYSDPAHALRIFGWRAQTTLSSGLRETLEWLRSHPELVQKSFENSILASKRD